jgi:hypothetical protein
VQVRHDEGVANRIGPEPCVVTRKGNGEASAGEPTGQPLSPIKIADPSADAVAKAEGNPLGYANRQCSRKRLLNGPKMASTAVFGIILLRSNSSMDNLVYLIASSRTLSPDWRQSREFTRVIA